MLLLHLMYLLCPEKIRAIYIDHQLQSMSGEWGDFVKLECQKLAIPCIIQKVNVTDGNLENQAREARYSAYLEHLAENEVLVLAHHQQDQAETVMLRLLSGAGVNGLSAMQAVDNREQLTIWRPLLDLSREQICQWVTELNINYIDDPSNLDTHYDRAWCRHELWNILQSRYPKMQQALARTSYLMQDASAILHEVLIQDLQYSGDQTHIDLEKLSTLSLPRQRQLLSAWMKGQETYRPAFDMVERLQNEVIASKSDRQAALHFNGYYYARYQNKLYRLHKDVYLAEKEKSDQAEQQIIFKIDQKIDLASGHFQIKTAKLGLSPALLTQKLDLKYRVGGEKIHLYGRVGAWPLKKAIQEAQIFPWMRHTIQILSIDNVMLGVFTPKGFWLAESRYCENDGWQPELVFSL